MKKYIAVIAMLAVGAAYAETIQMGSNWTDLAQGTGAAMTLSGETTNSFSVNVTRGGSIYQTATAGDFAAMSFGVGETAILAYTVTLDAAAGQTEPLDFRCMLWDDDQVSGQGGASARMDWGPLTAAGVLKMGVGDNAKTTGIGTQDQTVQSTDEMPSTPFVNSGDSATIVMSVTKQGANLFDVSLVWDDVTISTNGISNGTADPFNEISGVGIRLAGSAGQNNQFTVSGLSVSVIPEPATIGLVSLLGGAMLFIRRLSI